MAAHLDHDAACERDEAVAAPRRLATRALHPLRTAGRAVAARVVADAQSALVRAGDGACTDRAIARRLSVNKQHATAFSRIASIALRGYLAALRRVAR